MKTKLLSATALGATLLASLVAPLPATAQTVAMVSPAADPLAASFARLLSHPAPLPTASLPAPADPLVDHLQSALWGTPTASGAPAPALTPSPGKAGGRHPDADASRI